MTAQRKKTLGQLMCEAIVHWMLASTVRHCWIFLKMEMMVYVLDAWPKTVAGMDARRICPLLAEGYVQAVERGRVDMPSTVAWRLKHRGLHNSSVQEKVFAQEVCKKLTERFMRCTQVASPEGAWEVERALRDLESLEYRIDLKVLEKAVMTKQLVKQLLPPDLGDEALEKAVQRLHPWNPLNLLKKQAKEKAQRKHDAGRRLTSRECQLLELPF